MPRYHVPVTYMMWGNYFIEADTPEEAARKVLDESHPLPEDTGYLDDSMEVFADEIAEVG